MNNALKPARIIPVVVVLAVGGGIVASAMTSPRQGYAPQQPILFQHSRMAAMPNWVTEANGKEVNKGGFDIPCVYCHNMPYKGRHSTLPATAICMNCHSTVGQDKEWVLVLKDYHERGEPIPWVKVHDLPDFVYYDHSAHLNAKHSKETAQLAGAKMGGLKLDCVDCHGEVENMEVVAVQNRFNMGWCLDCHKEPDMAAPTDCVTCHR